MNHLQQSEASECGLVCVAMVASAHGQSWELHELRRKLKPSSKGSTLRDVMGYAAALNFSTRPLKLDMDDLPQLRLPCILHWDMNHFVVLAKVGDRYATIVDPAVGRRRIALSDVSSHFTGIALELAPNTDFKPVQPASRLALSSLTGKVLGLNWSLLQIFSVALVLELFAIASPLLNQLIVDEAIATNDMDLLWVLVLGFGLLLLMQTLLGLARAWMVLRLSTTVGLQWASNVFAHLTRLPVDFFDRRHLGDIISRFDSVDTMQRTLTTRVIEALIDGIMALAALGMMLLYSPKLTAVVVVAVLLYGLLRWLAYGALRNAAHERLIVSARERSYFMETIRAILPLKLFGREHERRASWQNLAVEVQNCDLQTGKMNIAFQTASTLILGIENLVVFGLGGSLAMESVSAGAWSVAAQSPFTVGMLFAFVAYKGQFTGRLTALINYTVEIKMLGLHVQRLADIALTEPEELDEVPESDLSHLDARIELRNVSFRYSEGEPWILKDANLVVLPGDSLAIVGASGCGKTTLLKILLGLCAPSEGEILYGGHPVRQVGVRNFRRLIGTVMQEDTLLAGSIGENIAFFDVHPDGARIEACAKDAALHDDIARMPMGYNTLVGDMGSSLSGGQKQRLLLARALYKQPRILALDEATSHLDVANERRVIQTLAAMEMTRIVVAHRPETIAAARRVIALTGGRLVEVQPAH